VWSQLKVSEKTALLTALGTGLSSADVEFLDEVRGEKSIQVTRVALTLLARIPDGAFADRRAEMLSSHVSVRKTIFGAGSLHVLAFEPDPKEGISEGASQSVISFIETTPLNLWTSVLGFTLTKLAHMGQTGVSFPAPAAFLAAGKVQRNPEVIEQMSHLISAPWTHLDADDLAILNSGQRIDLTRRAMHEAGDRGGWVAISWLGSPLPPEILDDVLSWLSAFPVALTAPEVGPALLGCSAAQAGFLRVVADSLPAAHKEDAHRVLHYLTLLTRLDQELS
jgi:hypothetical protein